MAEDVRGAGHVALAEVLAEVSRLRGSFPPAWAPLLARLADRDGQVLAELGRLEAVVAGQVPARREAGRRTFEMVAVVTSMEVLDGEAGRAAELWRWLVAHWGSWG